MGQGVNFDRQPFVSAKAGIVGCVRFDIGVDELCYSWKYGTVRT